MSLLNTQIAWRYLIGKKSTNAINLITSLSILGITIGTTALILILSVFNGFEGLLSGLFNAFNPDLKISSETGKTLTIDSLTLRKIQGLDGVLEISRTLEEVALFEYKDVQEIGVIKGVDSNYASVTGLDSMVVLGNYFLKGKSGIDYGVAGVGLRNKLSLNLEDRLNPITVYMPLRSSKFNSKEYKFKDIYPTGVFSVRSESDQKYIISSLRFAHELLSVPTDQISYLEVKIDERVNETNLRNKIKKLIASPVVISNKYEQDASFLKIMNIEKWVSFLIASLTLLLIAFNLVGALWMIILEKKKDIAILKSIGFSDQSIRSLFLNLGLLITIMGILIGFIAAIMFYFLQKQYGIIAIPEGFLIDAYPIKLKLIDFLRVTITVLCIGFLASLLPAMKAANFNTFLRAD